MEFKKCVRCGSFFVTDGDVCQNCMPKDRLEHLKFQNYIDNNLQDTADTISLNTGISIRNVNRYLNQNGNNIQLIE